MSHLLDLEGLGRPAFEEHDWCKKVSQDEFRFERLEGFDKALHTLLQHSTSISRFRIVVFCNVSPIKRTNAEVGVSRSEKAFVRILILH